MNRSRLFTLAAVILEALMVGCSSTYNVGSTKESDMSCNEFQQEVNQSALTFHFNNTTVETGELIDVRGDSILWRKADDEKNSIAAITSLKKIVRKNRELGAIEGGLISGATYMLALFVAGGPPETRHGIPEVTTRENAWIYAGGSAAFLTGAVPGALIGHKVEYNFDTNTKK